MAAEWASALAEAKPQAGNEVASEVATAAESVAPAEFAKFAATGVGSAGNDLNMILDIPVQLTVELGDGLIVDEFSVAVALGEERGAGNQPGRAYTRDVPSPSLTSLIVPRAAGSDRF